MSGDDDTPPGAPWRALVGLIAVIVLVAGVMLIARELRQAARIQDCVASGRTNCVPISGASE
jgi:hypothetical protein